MNKYTVKISFNFVKEVVDYNFNLYMTSLCLESLFSNMPLEETFKDSATYFPLISLNDTVNHQENTYMIYTN